MSIFLSIISKIMAVFIYKFQPLTLFYSGIRRVRYVDKAVMEEEAKEGGADALLL